MFEDEDDEGGDQDDSQCPERPATEAHMVAFFGAIGKYSFFWSTCQPDTVRSAEERESGKCSWRLLGEQLPRGGELFLFEI